MFLPLKIIEQSHWEDWRVTHLLGNLAQTRLRSAHLKVFIHHPIQHWAIQQRECPWFCFSFQNIRVLTIAIHIQEVKDTLGFCDSRLLFRNQMSFSNILYKGMNEFNKQGFQGILCFEKDFTFSIPSSSKRFTTISVISVISIVPKKKYKCGCNKENWIDQRIHSLLFTWRILVIHFERHSQLVIRAICLREICCQHEFLWI